ncbi:uncharacterized protein LOC135309787 [Plodia interpunctella]|uniref:uncharacterized protein LOC135309787 n=1 Tax=Plodia interpunctella TaxID=58824 RepID=UPI003100C2F4
MGKRKNKDSSDYIKAKIRKLEKRLRRRRESSCSSDKSPYAYWDLSPTLQSVAESPEESPPNSPNIKSAIVDPGPSTSKQDECPVIATPVDEPNDRIPIDILDILGESKKKMEVFGSRIQEEISKRWGRILCEGLKREQKKEITENILVPENFQLVKAPKLNPEIAAVTNDSTKNRDKRLEGAQAYLGLGIAALTNIISSLIEKDLDKVDLIKRLSEVNKILLDLHFENTSNRRKLITYSLDKKFLDMIQDVERDSLLFGENLTDKIKASKSAEKSGLQIKKTNFAEVSTSKKTTGQQGNWRGPPRQNQRGNRRGGAKTRPICRPAKTSAPTTDRRQETSKTRARPRSRTR